MRLRVVALSGLFALLWSPVGPGAAEEVSTAQLQTRLDQSRAHLAALYARAASRSVQFDASQASAARAQQALVRERRAVRRAQAQVSAQASAVAALTLEQMQSGTGLQRYTTLLSSGDPREMLARAAAYDSTADAMAARLDELSARQVVHEAARQRLEVAAQREQAALEREQAARRAINAAIAESQRETRAAQAEQTAIARQLARRQHRAVEAVLQPPPSSVPSSPAAPTAPAAPAPAAPAVPAPPAVVQAAPPAPAPPPVAPADPEDAPAEPYGEWDKIAQCESGGNWHINTGNGYYGGLQFSAATWHSVGGPGLPHEHSREVQIKYAKILQARSGWGQWSCAWARNQ